MTMDHQHRDSGSMIPVEWEQRLPEPRRAKCSMDLPGLVVAASGAWPRLLGSMQLSLKQGTRLKRRGLYSMPGNSPRQSRSTGGH
jgi:hypothetical protein